MDLNYLLYRQQIEQTRAKTAHCREAGMAHAKLASLYELEIERVSDGNIRFGSGARDLRHRLDLV